MLRRVLWIGGMPLEGFHPVVAQWFRGAFEAPTPAQAAGWPAIGEGRHTLIAAPTGSGKTLAAFLCAIDGLVRRGLDTGLPDETHTVYVSPLKALSNDIDRNLQRPIDGIREGLARAGLPPVDIRTAVRTGDTPSRQRTAATKRPPHLFVTTPESLFILLTSEGGRRMLRTARTVIVDEIHALVRDKRGSHLALSLERLEALTEHPLTRIGLSATQRPIEEVARFLVGTEHVDARGTPDCTIVDTGHQRALDLALELPGSPLEAVMAGEVWEEVYDRLVEQVAAHRTTLVFVNTRRLAERVARNLCDRLGDDAVCSHHGSMSRERRLDAEQRLKSGQLRALVATASLELGIDVGEVELVCQLGSPRAISTLLQRVGRSGHDVGGLPKGRLFPLSRDELVECAALLDSVRRGELDRVRIPERPLDILAQQLVATVAAAGEQGLAEGDLLTLSRRAWPYRTLSTEAFEAVLRMLSEGMRASRGRKGHWLHRDVVHRRVRARRGARLAAITSGGAIPDTADYDVVLEPSETRVGTVNEDFAIESMAGDVFQLGNTSYRIRRVEPGRVRVEDAQGQPPSIPFWLGEAPGRSDELSASVSRLRAEIAHRLQSTRGDGRTERDDAAIHWLTTELELEGPAAEQLVEHLASACAALGALPTQRTLVLERFFDETGAMHLVLHAPFGSRLTRAFGLALRKRFCRRFNVELQAAATEDALVLSLGPTHSFAVEETFRLLRSPTVRGVLTQAVLDAPMFQTRWRWNAGRALAVLRFRGGRKVAPQRQRIEADDLLSVVFPDQVACLENVPGDREIPDHPLVSQTLHDCLTEAMDADGLEQLLRDIENGHVTCLARDLTEPSPLAQEILGARPYAFLDDAPLEERRTQAVQSRRWLDPESAAKLGALDEAAIARVREEAFPEARSADELHDALVLHAAIVEREGVEAGWRPLLDELRDAGRATVLRQDDTRLWIAAERLAEWRAVHPDARLEPPLTPPDSIAPPGSREDAVREVLRGRLDALGPVTTAELADALSLELSDCEAALAALEAEGAVLRGRFSPGVETEQWCERRLLARIHRYTLQRLRSEIQPVSATDFMRFLLRWQHATPDRRVDGPQGLLALLEKLEGFEAAATSWEGDLLPLRMNEYDPTWLDSLCLSGRVAWARRTLGSQAGNGGANGRAGPLRTTPITLLRRAALSDWLAAGASRTREPPSLSSDARDLLAYLQSHGASFFDDLVRGTALLRTQVESALGELVASGCVSSDGFSGLRALLVPAHRRGAPRRTAASARLAIFGMESAGRWTDLPCAGAEAPAGDPEPLAWALLRRWGVVFRKLLEREGPLPPWRELLRVYRRLEAQGLIRGGRFVGGFSGEQYALPEAVGELRRARRDAASGQLVSVGATDPLNLVGIVTPGRRLASVPSNRVLYRDGLVVAMREGGEVRFAEAPDERARWQLERTLVRRPAPAQLRPYLSTGT